MKSVSPIPFSRNQLTKTYVQTYTVDFDRKGEPALGHIVGRLKASGHRFIANHSDNQTLKRLSSRLEEPIGKSGFVKPDPREQGRNLFFFAEEAKL